MAREYHKSLEMFLKSNSPSLELEQDIYHLLVRYQPSPARASSAYQSQQLLHGEQDVKLYDSIGSKDLLRLLAYFSDDTRAPRARRWAGYVLLRLLTMSEACRQRLENGVEGSRRGMGGLMLGVAPEDLKIVAGRIIRVMSAGKLPADQFFPTDKRGRAAAAKFPATSDPESQWVSDYFQDFMDELNTEKLLEWVDSDVAKPLAVSLGDQVIDRKDGSFLVLVGQTVTVVVTPSSGVVEYVDIPVGNILAVKSRREDLQTSQGRVSSQVTALAIVLYLVSSTWTLLHNAAPQSPSTVAFVFAEGDAQQCADTARCIEDHMAEYRKGQDLVQGSATAGLHVRKSNSQSAQRVAVSVSAADESPLPFTLASQASQKSSISQTLDVSRSSEDKAEPLSDQEEAHTDVFRPFDEGKGEHADTNTMPPPPLPPQAGLTGQVKDAQTVLAAPDPQINLFLPELHVADKSSIPQASQTTLPAGFSASWKGTATNKFGHKTHRETSPLPPQQDDDDSQGLYALSPAGQKVHDLHVEKIRSSSQRESERRVMQDGQTSMRNSNQYVDPRDLHYSDPRTAMLSDQAAHSVHAIREHLNAGGNEASNNEPELDVVTATDAKTKTPHAQQDGQPPENPLPKHPSVGYVKSNKALAPAETSATAPPKPAGKSSAGSHDGDVGKTQAAERPVARAHAQSANAPSSKETQQSSDCFKVPTSRATRKGPKLKDLLRSEDGKSQSDLHQASKLPEVISTKSMAASKPQSTKSKPASASAAKPKHATKPIAGFGQKRHSNAVVTLNAESDDEDEQKNPRTAKKSALVKATAAKSTLGSMQSLKTKADGAGSFALGSGKSKEQDSPDIFDFPEEEDEEERPAKIRQAKKQKNARNEEDMEYKALRQGDAEEEEYEQDSPLLARSQPKATVPAVPRAKGQRQPRVSLGKLQPPVERKPAENDAAKAPAVTENTRNHAQASARTATEDPQRLPREETIVEHEDNGVLPPPSATDESQDVQQQEAYVQHENEVVALERFVAHGLQHQHYEKASGKHEDDEVVLLLPTVDELRQSPHHDVSERHGLAEALPPSAADEMRQLQHNELSVAHHLAAVPASPVPDKSQNVKDWEASVEHAGPPVPVATTDESGVMAGPNEGILSKSQAQELISVNGPPAEEGKSSLAPRQQTPHDRVVNMQPRQASQVIEGLTNQAAKGPALAISIVPMYMYSPQEVSPSERSLRAMREGLAPHSKYEQKITLAAEGSLVRTQESNQPNVSSTGHERRQVENITNARQALLSHEAPNAQPVQETNAPQSSHADPTKERGRNGEDFEGFERHVVNYSGGEKTNKVIVAPRSVVIVSGVGKENIPPHDVLQAELQDLQDKPKQKRKRAPKPSQKASTPPHSTKDLQNTPVENRKRARKPLQEAETPPHPKKQRSLQAGQGRSARHNDEEQSSEPANGRTYQPPMRWSPGENKQARYANVPESKLIDENVIRKPAIAHFTRSGPANQCQLSGRKRKSEELVPAPRRVKVINVETEKLGSPIQERRGQFSDGSDNGFSLITEDVAHNSAVRPAGWDRLARPLQTNSKHEPGKLVPAIATPSPPGNKGGRFVAQDKDYVLVGERARCQSDVVPLINQASSRSSHSIPGEGSPIAVFPKNMQPNVRQCAGATPTFEDVDSPMVAGETFLDGAQDIEGLGLNDIDKSNEDLENDIQYVQSRNGEPVPSYPPAEPSAIIQRVMKTAQPGDVRTVAASMRLLSTKILHDVSSGKQPTKAQMTRFMQILEAGVGDGDSEAVQGSHTENRNIVSACVKPAMATHSEGFEEDTTLVNGESEAEDSGLGGDDGDEEESIQGEPSSSPSSGDRKQGRTEEMEWEDSLKPDQDDLVNVLCRISHKLVRHLVSSETAVSDIIADYASGGEILLTQMEKCHGEDLQAYTKSYRERMRSLGEGLAKAETALSEGERAFETGRDAARAGVRHGEWTKESRKGRKELEGCLKSVEDLARMVA